MNQVTQRYSDFEVPDDEGFFVLHSDYAALERERDELRGGCEELRLEILSDMECQLKLRAELSTLKAEMEKTETESEIRRLALCEQLQWNPDGAEPRAKTWRGERQNWETEVERLKAENERLRGEVCDLQDELRDTRDGGMPTLDSDGVQQTL
jgi:chromosome segregation ATPase